MTVDKAACPAPSDGLTIYFNPFAFTIEQNNEFLRRGYEVMPLRIPRSRQDITDCPVSS